jgi:hypothetical protein
MDKLKHHDLSGGALKVALKISDVLENDVTNVDQS